MYGNLEIRQAAESMHRAANDVTNSANTCCAYELTGHGEYAYMTDRTEPISTSLTTTTN